MVSLTCSFQFYKFLITVLSIDRSGDRLTVLPHLNRGKSKVWISDRLYYMPPLSFGDNTSDCTNSGSNSYVIKTAANF